jgi:hypothetical protein
VGVAPPDSRLDSCGWAIPARSASSALGQAKLGAPAIIQGGNPDD